MSNLLNTCLHRQAIDNRLNRDLIARARTQGFVFSNPFDDAQVWANLETTDLGSSADRCEDTETDWLFIKAIEATLFLIYHQNRLALTC